MAGNAFSRLLGLVREQVIAGLYGTSGVTSAFATAATVPTMFYDLLIGGAVSAALVPTLSRYSEPARRPEFGRLVLALSLIGGALGIVAASFTYLAAPLIALALGATSSPAFGEQTSAYLRLLAPAVIFLGLSAITGAANYARNRNVWPAFATSGFNAGLIAGALLLVGVAGPASLAIGLVVGAGCQLLLQLPGLRDLRPAWPTSQTLAEVASIGRLYLPVLLGLVVTQIGVVIDRNLAWRTGEDSVAIMRFATTLVQFPLGLVATATAFAVLADLSRAAGEDSEESRFAFARTLSQGIRLSLVLIVPATVGLAVLSRQVVEVLFERGAFDTTSTERTALAFLIYAPQMPFVAVDQLLVFAFYARRNTVTPALVGLAGVVFYLIFGLVSIGPLNLGVYGLVLANTLQNSLHAIALIVLMRGVIGDRWLTGMGKTLRVILVASVAVGAVMFIGPWFASGKVLGLVIAIVVGGVVYLVLLGAQKSEELAMVISLVRKRLGRD